MNEIIVAVLIFIGAPIIYIILDQIAISLSLRRSRRIMEERERLNGDEDHSS